MIMHTTKEEGETPLELIGRLREGGKIGKDEKATYAGRLDPMASGAMIILTGEDVHCKEEFMRLDKEYEVEVLFGFGTDSHDILGKVMDSLGGPTSSRTWRLDLPEALQSFVGKFEQEYPRYSSRIIAMAEVPDEMPKREVEIYSIDFIEDRAIPDVALLGEIEERIAKVKGDFRQEGILNLWREVLGRSDYPNCEIIKIKVICGSGTYMRVLSHGLGRKLGVPALAYSIRRTRIG